jgi:hypothetical protein
MQTDNADVTTSPGFWANLNVFIPAWLVLNVAVGWLLSMALMAPLMLVSFVTGPFGDALWLSVLQILFGPALITAFLVWRWAKHGLVPAAILRISRYRVGQGLLVLANVLLPGGFLALTLYSQFLEPDVSAVAGWILLPMAVIAMPAAAIGLWLVWSSRNAPEIQG